MDQAFRLLRDFARNRNLRLSKLARAFIDGSESLTRPDPGQAAAAATWAGGPPAPAGLAAQAVDLARGASTPPPDGHQ